MVNVCYKYNKFNPRIYLFVENETQKVKLYRNTNQIFRMCICTQTTTSNLNATPTPT